MKIHILYLLLLLACSRAHSQNTYNEALKTQLDSILKADQKYQPVFYALLDSAKSDSLVRYFKMPLQEIEPYCSSLQEKLNSSNLSFVEQIISKYGYPGKSLVGEPTNKVAWNVIQHSDKIPVYFNIIQKAGKKKEIPYTLACIMEDRLLVEQKKEQKYGTQIARRKLKDGKEEIILVWPIKNAEAVNKRRKKAGFDTTIEEYASRFHITYTRIELQNIEHIN